jgi:hypothetical protein
MPAHPILTLPRNRRDWLYEQIRRIVEDHEAADRALAGVGERLDSDEPLAAIIELVKEEMPPVNTTARSEAAAG